MAAVFPVPSGMSHSRRAADDGVLRFSLLDR